jgi:hypothetical protein
MLLDRRTDRQDEANSRFSQFFANAPKQRTGINEESLNVTAVAGIVTSDL